MKEINKALGFTFLIAMIMTIMLPMISFAQEAAQLPVAVASSDIGSVLLNLIMNWKTMGPLGIAIVVVNLIVSVMKSDSVGNIFKKLDPLLKGLLITVLGQIAGILSQVVNGVAEGKSMGAAIASSILFGLVTSGGAVAIYQAYKLFKKQAML